MLSKLAATAVLLLISASIVSADDGDGWDKTFPLSDQVVYEEVTFTNRYGITVAGDMYLPGTIDRTQQYPAIIVGTPYGGVKEQGAGIYAQTMAERGFVTIAFDESFNGESGGEPRHVSSPDVFVEDFSAAVDFMGTRPFVDPDRIGVIGICGSGAFAITAAQVDPRIRAVATASMYDMSRVLRYGWMDGMTEEQRRDNLEALADQRWEDFQNGSPYLPTGFPSEPAETIPEGLDPITSEFFEYYAMERGFHPNSLGGFTTTSRLAFMNFPLMNYIGSISPRPILFIMGENAHSRYFTEDAYEMAAEPKELYIVPGARHIDLYDRTDLIPFDKLEEFFTEHLINDHQEGDIMHTVNDYIFPKGLEGPDAIFTGTTHVNMLITDSESVYDTQAYDVRFEPGARTFWHSHPGGQLLFVTAGTGYYQAQGQPARLLQRGDVVEIPPDVVHWHGAAPNSEFVHLGVSPRTDKGPAAWFGEVTEEDYQEAVR